MRLVARSLSFTEPRFAVVTPEGATVAELFAGHTAPASVFEADGVLYRVHRDPRDGAVVLTNTATGLPEAQVEGGSMLELTREVVGVHPDGQGARRVTVAGRGWGTTGVALRVDGAEVGAVQPDGPFRRTRTATLPDDWPRPFALFVLWAALRAVAEAEGDHLS